MAGLPRFTRAICVLLGVLCVVACGGSHTSLPPMVANSLVHGGKAHASAVGSDVVAINAGGAAAGSFSADMDYTGSSSWGYSVTNTIDTSAIANPAPQAVYASGRTGSTFSYTIGGLTPGASYTAVLSFAELWWTAAGKRLFNVSINNTAVLTKFDIYATAGARFKAIAQSFPATANASGNIVIAFTSTTDNAQVNAIEIAPASSPAPSPTPTAAPSATPTANANAVLIDAGGAASGNFSADADYAANGTWAYVSKSTVATTGVTNPAPQAVYGSARDGTNVTYTIPNLSAGAPYSVRLDFAELWWTTTGQRLFNVSINNTQVLSNFDIVAAAGGAFKAVSETFNATASSTGTITIAMTAMKDYANVNGIEITPVATSTVSFNDYSTFGYDNARDVFNPNTTAITPASVPNIHLAWHTVLGGGDYNTQTQPVLATEIPGHQGVLFVGGGSGNVYAYDALTGGTLWTHATGQEQYACENGYNAYFGVGGSAAYDPSSKAIYIVGNTNGGTSLPATSTLYKLDGASGTVLGQVSFATPNTTWASLDFAHTSVTLANGTAYVGTGATCDISSWRGRVVAINVGSMTVTNTFFPAWNGTAQPWGGGGVWGWGGVSVDAGGNVYTGVGNTDNGTTTHGSIVAPFSPAPYEYSAYGDALVKLSSNLGTVEASHHPISAASVSGNSIDLDVQGTPLLFQPNGTGCDQLAALQGKSGTLYFYDTTAIGNGPIAQYQLAPSTYADGFLGGPAYSPVTGLVYVGVSSSNSSLFAPGMIAINPGCGSPSVVWKAAFGPDSYEPGSTVAPGIPRSVPAATAGGVVFIGTSCTPSGNTCSATTVASFRRRAEAARRIPLICCAPPGTGGGAVWALDASTGAVLNGGNPLIITVGTLRMPPTIDGNWIYVLDNSGNLYGLTVDPSYPAIASKHRAVPHF